MLLWDVVVVLMVLLRGAGRAWQGLMKEIDGLIARSHYGVIEWLCTYDQTVSADVARKRSAWSCVGGGRAQPPPCTPERCSVWGSAARSPGDPHSAPRSGLCWCPGAPASGEGMERVSSPSSGTGSPKPIAGWALGHPNEVFN